MRMRGNSNATLICITAFFMLCIGALEVSGQDPSLRFINADTEVRRIAFRGNQTFSDDQLLERIATRAPSFLERLTRPVTTRAPFRWIPAFRPQAFPFSPIELQRDVVRLRLFYRDNGFPQPDIDYIAQFDEDRNRIRIFFIIDEGPPLRIETLTFVTPAGDAAEEQFPAGEQEEWLRFKARIELRQGERYTEFNRIRLQDETLQWLMERGYAFARVNATVDVNAQANTADLNVTVDAGPRGYISEIQIEGLESVDESVILRALPFRVGDQFSNRRLLEGQRQIFGLNLFRVALADIPSQPRDSLVAVRYRIREARPRYIGAQTGYTQDRGVQLQGQWQHRNFFGAARLFTATALFSTGWAAFADDGLIDRSAYRLSASLRQPYLGIPRTSAIITPFFQRQTERAYDVRDYGLTTTFIYDFYRFRTISLQHSVSRATTNGLQIDDEEPPPIVGPPIDEPPPVDDPDDPIFSRRPFNRNILTLAGTFGRADDYFYPRRGFLVRPFAEGARSVVLASAVEYFKLGTEATAYTPLTSSAHLSTRLFVGQIWPYGRSADQDAQVVRERFRDIRFYAGGSNDIRGWHHQMLGPKRSVGTRYVPIGGLAKLAGNIEFRLPIPGLGQEWGAAAFLDFGNIWEDQVVLNPVDLRYGAGSGIRYETPVGPIRIDVAYKLNPSAQDIRPGPGQEPRFWERVAFYFSIGPTF